MIVLSALIDIILFVFFCSVCTELEEAPASINNGTNLGIIALMFAIPAFLCGDGWNKTLVLGLLVLTACGISILVGLKRHGVGPYTKRSGHCDCCPLSAAAQSPIV